MLKNRNILIEQYAVYQQLKIISCSTKDSLGKKNDFHFSQNYRVRKNGKHSAFDVNYLNWERDIFACTLNSPSTTHG